MTCSKLKPSAHSTIFVAEDEDFCHWQRKLAVCGKHVKDFCRRRRSSISNMLEIFFVADDRSKISVASDKNRAVCARL